MFGGANPLLMSSAGAVGAGPGAVRGGDQRPIRDGTDLSLRSINTYFANIFSYDFFSPPSSHSSQTQDIPRGVAAGMRVNNPLMQSQRFQRGVVTSSPTGPGEGDEEFSDA